MVFWHAIAIVAIFVLGCKTGEYYAKNTIGKNKKQLEKLEKLHEKENAIVEKINEVIEEEEDEEINEDWEGTD